MKHMLSLVGILIFSCCATSAQGIFDDKFDDCGTVAPCFYCGDTSAHYIKSLSKYCADHINHSINNSTYNLKNFNVLYEVFVDSSGRTCVTSVGSLGFGYSLQLRDDVRRWLTDMDDWKPAVKSGKPISSSVVIECKFRNNFLGVQYVKPPVKKSGED